MPFRIFGTILVLAFLAVALRNTATLRQERVPVSAAESAQRAHARRFWDSYRAATHKRMAGDLQGAIADYQAALALKPDHEDTLYYLGNCYFETGRYNEALSTYRQLIATNRLASSRGYVQLALTYACLDAGAPFDPEQAERFFQKALQMDPENGAVLGAGEVYLLRDQRQKAWEALRSADADNTSSVAAPYLLGYLCWEKGEQDEAWRWFLRAVQHCRIKKPPVNWTQEGDIKADPELRWRALARQSVFGRHWIRLRAYAKSPRLSPSLMEREYRRLRGVLAAVPKGSRSIVQTNR